MNFHAKKHLHDIFGAKIQNCAKSNFFTKLIFFGQKLCFRPLWGYKWLKKKQEDSWKMIFFTLWKINAALTTRIYSSTSLCVDSSSNFMCEIQGSRTSWYNSNNSSFTFSRMSYKDNSIQVISSLNWKTKARDISGHLHEEKTITFT